MTTATKEIEFRSPREAGIAEALAEHRVAVIKGALSNPADLNKKFKRAHDRANALRIKERLAHRAFMKLGLEGSPLDMFFYPEDITVRTTEVGKLALPIYMRSAQRAVDETLWIMKELEGRKDVTEALGGALSWPNLVRFFCSPKNHPDVAFSPHQDSLGCAGLASAAQAIPTHWKVWRPFNGTEVDLEGRIPDLEFDVSPGDLVMVAQGLNHQGVSPSLRQGERDYSDLGSAIHEGAYSTGAARRYGAGAFRYGFGMFTELSPEVVPRPSGIGEAIMTTIHGPYLPRRV